MSKYIKLEDAIEAIEDKIAEYIPVLYGRYCEMPLEIRMAIEHLPPIEVSEDCISREYLLSKVYDMDNDYLVVDLKDIENAPSVVPTTEQSSIVRCKDCTHYHSFKHYAYCTVINVKGKHPQPTDYCSYAEEKTFT